MDDDDPMVPQNPDRDAVLFTLHTSRRWRTTVGPMVSRLHTFLGQDARAYGLWTSSPFAKGYPETRRSARPSPETAVCIDGPAGSGNSFFVRAFLLANPRLRVAHHQHVASQIKGAVSLGLPTVALLRNPQDSVTSRACRSPHMIGALYYQWILFFRAADAARDRLVLGSFESATSSPARLIQHVNRRYRTAFSDRVPDKDTVFAAMDSAFSDDGDMNPNRPHSERERLKQRIRPRVLGHRLAPIATALYLKLLRHSR